MSGLYARGKNQIGQKAINLVSDSIKAILVDTTYTPNLTSDSNLSDIVSGKRVSAGVALTTKALSAAGVFSADPTLFAAVTTLTGQVIGSIVLYLDTGVEATSTLIHVHDTGAGLPYTPVGADITVKWSTGVNKIFAL